MLFNSMWFKKRLNIEMKEMQVRETFALKRMLKLQFRTEITHFPLMLGKSGKVMKKERSTGIVSKAQEKLMNSN